MTLEERVHSWAKGGMARPVLRMGVPTLREPSSLIKTPDSEETKAIVRDLSASVLEVGFNTVAGLAAPQIGINKRVIYYTVYDEISKEIDAAYFLINPTYEPQGEALRESIESCLSVPGLVGVLDRYETIKLKAVLYDGEIFQEVERMVSGNEARVLQHEIDHLDGVLYVDRLVYMEDLSYTEEFKKYHLQGEE